MFWRLSSARTSTNAVKSGVISEILYGVIDLLHRLSFKAFFWHFTGSYCSFFFFYWYAYNFLLLCGDLKTITKHGKRSNFQWTDGFFKTWPPPGAPTRKKKNEVRGYFFFLMERQNKTKIRQHLAFQYGIYAVKRGIYPFVTPESSSDMRAWAGADVTHKPWGEGREEGREEEGVKYRHVAGIFSTVASCWWTAESMRSEKLWWLIVILSDTVFTW